jgi:hypothetical protein
MPKTRIDNAGFIPATPFRQAVSVSGSSMTRTRSLPLREACLAFLGLSALFPSGIAFELAPPALAQSGDPIVTSDSPEYCGVLMDRITGITHASVLPPPTEAATLSQEGERMCVHGQTRGGILRLRRALEILRHGED